MADTDTAPISGFNTSHLTDSLFQDILAGINKDATLESWSKYDITSAHGYLADAETSGSSAKRLTGFLGYEIKYTLPDSKDIQVKKVVLKSKPRDKEILSHLENIFPDLEENITIIWKEFLRNYNFNATDRRELLFIQMEDPVIHSIMPDIYWSMIDEKEDIFVFAMEYFDPDNFSHINTFSDVSVWKEDDIFQMLQGIASVHARYYENIGDIPSKLRQHLPTMNKTYLMELASSSHQLMELGIPHCQEDLWGKEGCNTMSKVFKNIQPIADLIDNAPKTLIHNDYSLRNLCMRKEPADGKRKVCVYDWEVICIGIPQRDLAECLKYYLTPNSSLPSWDFYIEHYFKFLQMELDKYESNQSKKLEFEKFKRVFDAYMMVMSLALYGGFASVMYRKYKFPPAKYIFETVINYIQRSSEKYSFLQ